MSEHSGPREGMAWQPDTSGNTVSWDGSAVIKRHRTDDGYAREHAVLTRLTGLPLPRVLPDSTPGELRLAYVDGISSAEVIEAGHATALLEDMGRFLRRLHAVDARIMSDVLPGQGTVIVHGDFAHYNAIMDRDGSRLLAMLDWEGAHIGDPVLDLAWCEWQFRNSFPRYEWALSSLFSAYGDEPDWTTRDRVVKMRLDELRRSSARPSVELAYHVLSFERFTEAAAFVAALSRALDSPRESAEARGAVEVWSDAPAPGDVVELYLSDAALDAATVRFGPIPAIEARRGEVPPDNSALIIDGAAGSSLGLADAERRLSSGGAR